MPKEEDVFFRRREEGAPLGIPAELASQADEGAVAAPRLGRFHIARIVIVKRLLILDLLQNLEQMRWGLVIHSSLILGTQQDRGSHGSRLALVCWSAGLLVAGCRRSDPALAPPGAAVLRTKPPTAHEPSHCARSFSLCTKQTAGPEHSAARAVFRMGLGIAPDRSAARPVGGRR